MNQYEMSTNGLRINDEFFPKNSIVSFKMEEETKIEIKQRKSKFLFFSLNEDFFDFNKLGSWVFIVNLINGQEVKAFFDNKLDCTRFFNLVQKQI